MTEWADPDFTEVGISVHPGGVNATGIQYPNRA